MELRFFEDGGLGLGWIAPEPALVRRASHALADGSRVWVIDPVAGEGLEARVRSLGEPAGVIQLLDRHNRDCAAVAGRLGVPLHRLPFGGLPDSPFRALGLLDRRGWREVALWWPERRALVCAEAVGTGPNYLGPGERIAVHPFLRLRPPTLLRGLEPEHVLCGHGEGIHGPGAAFALEEALTTARRRAPRWLWHQLRGRRP